MKELVSDLKIFIIFFFAFIFLLIIGTILHELSHLLVAKALGYETHLHYNWTSVTPTDIIENKSVRTQETESFWIAFAGSFQTIFFGAAGLSLLILNRKSIQANAGLAIKYWCLIFLALFWLQNSINLILYFLVNIQTGNFPESPDEAIIGDYWNVMPEMIMLLTGLIGIIALIYIIKTFIPKTSKTPFIWSCILGSAAGLILWMELLGPWLLP
jgi:hypothetical protein